jgi:hypothetical protein
MTTSSSPNAQPPIFPSLDQIAPYLPPITWLWPGWIPRGMITLLCAAPGAGKSYFALDLARRLIAGEPWPDGTPSTEPGAGAPTGNNVIYVDAESAPQLLNARAVAWGMDRTRLYPMLGAAVEGPLDLNKEICQARLGRMAQLLHPALVIVDSLGSASRGAESRLSAVDSLFRFLNELAVRHQAAILLLHHLRRNSAALGAATLAGDEVRGSGHIVSLARSVVVLAPVQTGLDPQPDAPRRLQLLKSNLGPRPAALDITFVPQPDGSVGLTYGPAATGTCGPRTQVEACARWLLDLLARLPGPASASAFVEPASQAGYSRATLYRARGLLGPQVADIPVRGQAGISWVLAPWPRPKPLDNPAPAVSKT